MFNTKKKMNTNIRESIYAGNSQKTVYDLSSINLNFIFNKIKNKQINKQTKNVKM